MARFTAEELESLKIVRNMAYDFDHLGHVLADLCADDSREESEKGMERQTAAIDAVDSMLLRAVSTADPFTPAELSQILSLAEHVAAKAAENWKGGADTWAPIIRKLKAHAGPPAPGAAPEPAQFTRADAARKLAELGRAIEALHDEFRAAYREHADSALASDLQVSAGDLAFTYRALLLTRDRFATAQTESST